MSNQPSAKITIHGNERDLMCRVQWDEGLTEAARSAFLASLTAELDRIMRESNETRLENSG